MRKLSFGVGVERTFPVHSPKIERIEVVGRGEVRRAKLYYLRGRVGRAARLREMRDFRPEEVGHDRRRALRRPPKPPTARPPGAEDAARSRRPPSRAEEAPAAEEPAAEEPRQAEEPHGREPSLPTRASSSPLSGDAAPLVRRIRENSSASS